MSILLQLVESTSTSKWSLPCLLTLRNADRREIVLVALAFDFLCLRPPIGVTEVLCFLVVRP